MMHERLGVYIHWPFCAAKCPYCDFNSHVRPQIDQAAWRAALLSDLAHQAQRFSLSGPATSIFFGGGTPSLMAPATAGALIEAVDRRIGLAPEAEITLEANPSSVEAARFADLRAAGVNRVSLGVQALNAPDLRQLGRLHGVEEALRAIDTAARTFDRFSFDLIYARPGQTLEGWRAELQRALSLAGRHVSLYQLTIEPGTQFHTLHRLGKLSVPEEDHAADLFDVTQEVMESAELPAYEVSNHARPGEESRHNLIYWQGYPYLGIGPGAHGRVPHGPAAWMATTTYRLPEHWRQAVSREGHGIETITPLTADDRLAELLMMGLRLRSGLPRQRFHDTLGRAPESVLPGEPLARLRDLGMITLDTQGLRPTEEGWRCLNTVVAELLP